VKAVTGCRSSASTAAGSGVRWDAGEVHTSGPTVGFTAIAVEGAPLALFEPEANA
jgi:hypothetical protein